MMEVEPASLSKSSMEEVNENIIRLFECPICYDYLLPPIHQCKNAHNICSACKNKVKECPSCREPFLITRSVFVEQIALKLFYPCQNADVGCKEKKLLTQLHPHQMECPYRLYECLVGKESNCLWKGRRFDIIGHAKTAHATNAWMGSDNSIFYDSDITQGIEDIQLVSALNEVFWYHFKYDVEIQKLFIALQFIGPKEEASSFKYTLHVTASFDEEVGITFRNRAQTDSTPVSEIYENCKCVVMPFDMFQRFLCENGSFSFVLKVEKAHPAP